MPVLYSDEGLTIRKSWFFNKISVVEHSTRRKVAASALQSARCAFFIQIQSQLELTASERDFVLRYIFARFGMAVLHPNSLPAQMFMEGDGQRFLGSAVWTAKGT
jgi:hypothetical protein